jgi:hypothetical protein
MKRIEILLLVLISFSVSALAQTEIAKSLHMAGFEHIKIKQEGDTMHIFFEHRNFRNPANSMQYASAILDQKTNVPIKFIPVFHNRPVGVYESGNLSFQKLSKKDRKWYNKAKPIEGHRLSLRIMPDFTAAFGNYEEPFANRTNVILDTRVYLYSGLSLHTGLLIPLNNSLDGRRMEPGIGPTHFSYFYSKSSKHFLLAHAGLFLSDRYGVDFQYRFAPLRSNLSFGLSGSFTGIYFIDQQTIYRDPLENWTGVIDLEWRIPVPGIVMKGSYGKFLFDDIGYRIDLLRQYGSIDFGIHYAQTNFGKGIGLQIAFPLFPGKLIRSGGFELRTTEEFRWEYFYFLKDPVARHFRTGMPRLDDAIRQYQRKFIQEQR